MSRVGEGADGREEGGKRKGEWEERNRGRGVRGRRMTPTYPLFSAQKLHWYVSSGTLNLTKSAQLIYVCNGILQGSAVTFFRYGG